MNGIIFNQLLQATEPVRAPVTYHVQIAPELVRALELYSATQNQKPETIIAEAVRAYLGVVQ